MKFTLSHFACATMLAIVACKPPYNTSRIANTSTAPTGLLAVVNLEESDSNTFKVTCLDGTKSTLTKADVTNNKLCEPAPIPAAKTAVQTSGENGLTLYLGHTTYIKSEPLDCNANSAQCIENENSCKIEVGNSPVALTVESVQTASTHAYDHVVATRAATANCKLTNVYIYFPHIIVPIKFATSTSVSGCSVAANTVLEGAIQRDPRGTLFSFLVSKGSGCTPAGKFLSSMDYSRITSPSPIISAILGQQGDTP